MTEDKETVVLDWRIEINLYDSQMSLLDTETYWVADPGKIGVQMEKIILKWPSMYQAIVSIKKGEAP